MSHESPKKKGGAAQFVAEPPAEVVGDFG